MKASIDMGAGDTLHQLWIDTIIDAYEAIGELRARVENLEDTLHGRGV